jgi:hypothetical protein
MIFIAIASHLNLFSQIKSVNPVYYKLSKIPALDLFDQVGKKTIFAQSCTPLLPERVVNGSVFHENFFQNELKIKANFYLEDTVLINISYNIAGNINDALHFLNISTATFQHLYKKNYHYVKQENNTIIDCWIFKKKVIYSKTAIRKEDLR